MSNIYNPFMRFILITISLLVAAPYLWAQPAAPTGLEFSPAIGATGSIVKPTVSAMLRLPLNHRISVVSHSLFSLLLFRNQPQTYMQTHYNYSLTQKFGLGYALYGKGGKARHTVFLLGGIRYATFKESLDHPDLDRVTTVTSTVVPDYGLMYGLSLGRKRYTFDTRLYLPFSPIRYYPLGTLNNLVYLEFGIGIKRCGGNKGQIRGR